MPKALGKEKKWRGHLALRQGFPCTHFPKRSLDFALDRNDWSHITAEEKERRSSGARISTDFKKSLLRRIIFQTHTDFHLLKEKQ